MSEIEEVIGKISPKKYQIIPDHLRTKERLPKYVVFNFFAGILSFSYGMEEEGFKPCLYVDKDKGSRITIDRNRPTAALAGDLRYYDAQRLYDMACLPKNREVDIVIGSLPNEILNDRIPNNGFTDLSDNLMIRFLDIVCELKPKYFIFDTVRTVLTHPGYVPEIDQTLPGGALYYIIRRLESVGYSISFDLYNATNFGSAQSRDCFILIAKQGDTPVAHLSPTHTSEFAFIKKGLKPALSLGEVISDLVDKPNHALEYDDTRRKYFKYVEQGQNWKSMPPDIQVEAMGNKLGLSGGRVGFFRRLSMDKPSPTLVTRPNIPATDMCHPLLDRPLSVEEYRRICGLPDDWQISGSIYDLYFKIGRSLPVHLASAIARTIRADMKGTPLPQYDGFIHSRYHNTRDTQWRNSFLVSIEQIKKGYTRDNFKKQREEASKARKAAAKENKITAAEQRVAAEERAKRKGKDPSVQPLIED